MSLPLILLPGVLCNNDLWQNCAPLLQQDFSLYYADIPAQNNLTEMAKHFLQSMPKECWVIGFSLGAWIALEAIQRDPKKFAGLILISGSDGEIMAPTRIAMQKAITTIKQGQLENYIEECIPLYLTEKHSQDPYFRELLRTMMLQADPTIAVKQYEAIINMAEPFKHLAEINCPTLVIRGKYDQRHSLQGHQALSHKIPHSELVVIDDTAHFVPLENPRVLAEHIKNFIARNS